LLLQAEPLLTYSDVLIHKPRPDSSNVRFLVVVHSSTEQTPQSDHDRLLTYKLSYNLLFIIIILPFDTIQSQIPTATLNK
jgi:hypothetical protein